MRGDVPDEAFSQVMEEEHLDDSLRIKALLRRPEPAEHRGTIGVRGDRLPRWRHLLQYPSRALQALQCGEVPEESL